MSRIDRLEGKGNVDSRIDQFEGGKCGDFHAFASLNNLKLPILFKTAKIQFYRFGNFS